MRTLVACSALFVWTACSSDAPNTLDDSSQTGAVDAGGAVGTETDGSPGESTGDSGISTPHDAASGTDGGAGDAEAADTGHDASLASGCQSGAYLLCEDFESTAEGAIPVGWTKQGQVAVASDQPHRGQRSLKVGVATNGPRRINRPLAALGQHASDHWGRIFYKVASPAPTYNGYLHSTMVAMQGKSPIDGIDIEGRMVDTVQGPQATYQFIYNVQPSGRNEFGTGSDYNYRYDANWHCAEWHVVYATQSYAFFIDGVEVAKMRINAGAGKYTNVEIPSAYQSMSVGWNNYQVLPSGGFQAWIDDLAVGVNQIGCN